MRTSSSSTLRALALGLVVVGCSAAPHEEAEGTSTEIQGGQSDRARNHAFGVGIATRYGALCSGTLIAPNLVLTARHCLVVPDAKDSVSCADKFAPALAPSNLFVTTDPSIRAAKKLYRAREIITPKDTAFCGNDIGLIVLDARIPSSEARPATPVVDFSLSDRKKIGGAIAALGYGITNPSAKDSGVRRVRQDIEIVCVPGDDTYDCGSSYRYLVDSDREFITEGYVCSGDSGGGAFDQTTFAKGKPYVLGALSRGPQTDARCLAAVYSRTDAHADMIKAAGARAAKLGGYTAPSWAAAATPETHEGDEASEATLKCTGDGCSNADDVAETEPASAEDPVEEPAATSRAGACSSAPGPTGSSAALLLVCGALALVRRRRQPIA